MRAQGRGHSGTQCQGKTPDLFWTLNYVWCDANGDSAYLYDAQGNPVDRYEYGGAWHESPVVPCAPGGWRWREPCDRCHLVNLGHEGP